MKQQSKRILLVDDDEDMLRLLKIRIESEGYKVDAVSDGSQALTSVGQNPPDVVVTDLKMPGVDGMTLLELLQRETPTLPVIMMTAHGTIPDAIKATRQGAYGFITKPIDKDELIKQLSSATTFAASSHRSSDVPLISNNTRMLEQMSKAKRAASASISTMILGESGTGKELMARYIHACSGRAGEFVPVNCGAIPENLLESELFGHEKGAFTDASRSREGLIKLAHEGTLFLDEIGDMPQSIQAKLLRALQEKKIRPLGSRAEIDIDTLVVSATHRDIDAMVTKGDFRQDLFYRLNVVQLNLPPLRERPEDIPLLVHHFLKAGSEQARKVFAPEAMEVLVSHTWHGNIRQLGNVVEQTVALSPGPVISAAHVRDALGDQGSGLPSFDEAREEFTRNYLIQILKLTEGNVSKAASFAERNRTDFHKLLKKHRIEPKSFRPE